MKIYFIGSSTPEYYHEVEDTQFFVSSDVAFSYLDDMQREAEEDHKRAEDEREQRWKDRNQAYELCQAAGLPVNVIFRYHEVPQFKRIDFKPLRITVHVLEVIES